MSSPNSPESGSEGTPSTKSRMLVLCFDGTANEYDGKNTNVVKFFAMLRKDCDDEQLCYYQTGVGTYLPPGVWGAVGMWIGKILDEAIAWYLDAHVMAGYDFIMNNYQPGDKISIFGFSRGAYTARALAGFLTKIGLLPKDNDQQVTFAYKLYKRTDPEGLVLAAGFKETFCRPVSVEFLGVWDTVASTGIIMSRNLPFTTRNSLIKTFRHALSLDERRAKFVPIFWQPSTPQPAPPKPGQGTTQAALNSSTQGAYNEASNLLSNGAVKNKKAWKRWRVKKVDNVQNDIDPEESKVDKTDVKQVWFAGWHSDVGGGAVKNATDGALSDISLRWMVQEVIASQCGILFNEAVMDSLDVHISLPAPAYYLRNGKYANNESESIPGPKPSEQDCAADKIDAAKPLHNELRLAPLWWILEVTPLPFSWQDASGKWHKKWELHLGRGRYVNQLGPLLFHETVRIRMNDKSLNYTPAAKYEKGRESYVW